VPVMRSKSELEDLLNKALIDENYEEAAKIRDEIDKL
jgi:protein-arginine kinase activator protein McsA